MAYFSTKQDGLERACKVLADIFCALLIIMFSVVSFGLLGGLLAFIILEAALLSIDYLVPNADDGGGRGEVTAVYSADGQVALQGGMPKPTAPAISEIRHEPALHG